ncbi:Crp/Fnr family transcriptional regulator [Pseudobacter ginsenosidimutans]|nr:Crp/Fnr family transcriptional regulator [Pseudobacter ginsenosidimutans]
MSAATRPTATELQPVFELFNVLHPIGKRVEIYLQKNIYCCEIKKGELLVKSGEVCDSIYFIKRGVLRGFIEEGSREITTWLTVENEIVATITGFLLRKPTMENIQAIEDCELLGIKFEDLNRLYLKYPSFNIVGRKITELYYVYAEQRAYITRFHEAERKYEILMDLYPHYLNRIPLKYIASFLGITIETLSRVRAKAHTRSRKKSVKDL